MDRLKVRLEFITPLLGGFPKSQEVVDTGFPTDEKGPYLPSNVLRGHCKSACRALRKVEGAFSNPVTKKWSNAEAYRKTIDNGLFVEPRRLYLQLPDGEEIGELVRSFRVSGSRGDHLVKKEGKI